MPDTRKEIMKSEQRNIASAGLQTIFRSSVTLTSKASSNRSGPTRTGLRTGTVRSEQLADEWKGRKSNTNGRLAAVIRNT
jgi:hypothetical protein